MANTEEKSPIFNNLAKLMRSTSGKIKITINQKPTLSLDFQLDTSKRKDSKSKKVLLDLEDASLFGMVEGGKDQLGLLEKLKAAKNIAQILDDNDVTFSVLRKGKKAISLGKGVKPTLSRVLTGSDDIQIDSVRQATKLGRDIQKAKK